MKKDYTEINKLVAQIAQKSCINVERDSDGNYLCWVERVYNGDDLRYKGQTIRIFDSYCPHDAEYLGMRIKTDFVEGLNTRRKEMRKLDKYMPKEEKESLRKGADLFLYTAGKQFLLDFERRMSAARLPCDEDYNMIQYKRNQIAKRHIKEIFDFEVKDVIKEDRKKYTICHPDSEAFFDDDDFYAFGHYEYTISLHDDLATAFAKLYNQAISDYLDYVYDFHCARADKLLESAKTHTDIKTLDELKSKLKEEKKYISIAIERSDWEHKKVKKLIDEMATLIII